MGGDKHCVGQNILPDLADVDEIIAIGAVTVEKNHKRVGGARTRC
jgi:hypothetical protein